MTEVVGIRSPKVPTNVFFFVKVTLKETHLITLEDVRTQYSGDLVALQDLWLDLLF